MSVLNLPYPITGINLDHPLAKGLKLALPCNTPGPSCKNLIPGTDEGLFRGTPAAGGKGTNLTSDNHPSWADDLNTYSLVVWHQGFHPGDWNTIFGCYDSGASDGFRCNRNSSNTYFRYTHDSTNQNWTGLTTSEVASPAMYVFLWDHYTAKCYRNAVNVIIVNMNNKIYFD